jgi:hypothetical protein
MKAKLKFNTDGRRAVKPFLRRSEVVFNPLKVTAVAVILFATMLASACKESTTKGNGQVLATVGSHEITETQVDTFIKQQLGGASGQGLTPEALVQARLNVLSSLIQQEALFIKSQKENLVPDDTKVNEEYQKRIKATNLSKEDFDQQLKQSGMTEEQLREQIRKELAIAALVEKHVTNAVTEQPTNAEIERFFNERRAEFVDRPGVDLSVIVTDPRDNQARDDAKTEVAADQKIKDIYQQLRSGSDFATVAAQRSEHQTAAQSGALGLLTTDQIRETVPSVPGLAERLMAMRPGEYTEPIRETAANAFLIFKVNDKLTEARTYTLDDQRVRQYIIDAINRQRQQVLQNALVNVAIAESEVKNHLAERILENPKVIAEMRPSQLLQQDATANQQQQQPRFENQPASNANSNSAAAPTAPAGNANR